MGMGIRSPPRDVTHPDTDTTHANYEKENDRIGSSEGSSERIMS